MEESNIAFLCPFCNSEVYSDEIDPGDDYYDLIPKIGSADRFIDCSDCQCEILYSSETLQVVIIPD